VTGDATSTMPAAVAAYLARAGVETPRVDALTPDASDRRYFRVLPAAGEPFVVALMAAPFAPEALPFLNVARLLAEMPVRIPRVLGEAGDLGVLALEDLGDVTLQTYLSSAAAADCRARYLEAIGIVATLQRRGRELADTRYVPYTLAFDTDKLLWELRFFMQHFLEAHRGAVLTPHDRAVLEEEFLNIADTLAAEPRVLCHRDYHSRNLMVHDGRLAVIDFQDARLGPDTYDLVSLVRDAYVDLPADLVAECTALFFDAIGDRSAPAARSARLDLMGVQRGLKALGTFGYQAAVRHNATYLDAVPRTLAHVRRALYGYDRFARLRDVLGRHVAELHP
jgi:aminoglycoside/choline kinase family phosphotransferase